MLLYIGLSGIISAPLLYHGILKYSWGRQIQRIWLLVLMALVLIHLLPESFHLIGMPALILSGLGFLLPSFFEKIWAKKACEVHSYSSWFLWAGFLVHGIFDGAALSPFGFSEGCSCHGAIRGTSQIFLGTAVFLHKLTESLVAYSNLFPQRGFFIAILCLLGTGLAMILGYYGGHSFLEPFLSHHLEGYMQAFLAGFLAHVATDDHLHRHHH